MVLQVHLKESAAWTYTIGPEKAASLLTKHCQQNLAPPKDDVDDKAQ